MQPNVRGQDLAPLSPEAKWSKAKAPRADETTDLFPLHGPFSITDSLSVILRVQTN